MLAQRGSAEFHLAASDVSPLTGFSAILEHFPTAPAVGYVLSPLRGLNQQRIGVLPTRAIRAQGLDFGYFRATRWIDSARGRHVR
jgi:hypothetical protein